MTLNSFIFDLQDARRARASLARAGGKYAAEAQRLEYRRAADARRREKLRRAGIGYQAGNGRGY